MANEDHLRILRQGIDIWNQWREEPPRERPDLSGVEVVKSDLSNVNFSGANLNEAGLSGVNLQRATLVNTNLKRAIMNGCHIYGISAWKLQLEGAQQSNLVVTPEDQPTITVDSIEVAQFIYLLLNSTKVRDVTDTIGKKGVLILGRFKSKRKKVLDALRKKLYEFDFVPIMFDFEGVKNKDFAEIVMILAGMSRFIIADITMPKSIPMELAFTVPDFMIPFVPIILDGEEPFPMFQNLQTKYDWVLEVLEYSNLEQLIAVTETAIVQPALLKENELILSKAKKIRKHHVEDYLH